MTACKTFVAGAFEIWLTLNNLISAGTFVAENWFKTSKKSFEEFSYSWQL